MTSHRILIIETDIGVRRLIKANLEVRNYEILTASQGIEAMRIIENEGPDLVIMGVKLPDINSLELCQHIREQTPVSIILIGAYDDEESKHKYFNAGADDYVSVPFGVGDLLARMKAVLRRGKPVRQVIPAQRNFSNGRFEIRFDERRVTVDQREIILTPTEYNLLEELALNADKVIRHDLLLTKLWGPEYKDERGYLRVFVGRLRHKLEPDSRKPSIIVTVPWIGYKLNVTTNKS